VFVPNATTGVNIALQAAELTEGDEVIVTDHVYGAVARTAARDTARVGGVVRTAACDLTADVDAQVNAFLAVTTDATRVAIIDHVASPTGLVLPVAEIVAALRSRGVITIVDAAHAPGSRAVDVGAIGADFWTGNFHKWLSAPRPCAALAVADAWRAQTQPLVASFGIEDGFPTSFAWQGTDDYTSYLSLRAAVDALASLGWDALWAHNDALAVTAAQIVGDALGVAPALPASARSSMALLPLPNGVAATDADARAFIARVSAELKVEVAANPWRGTGWLRLCAHAYNQESDYEVLAAGLPALLRS